MASATTTAEEAGVSVLAPPRENLVRAIHPGIEMRSTAEGMRTLHGHFARFHEWAEIDSMWEGRFMEQIAPGAFKKTFQENRSNMKVLFDHGHDPQLGNKPLGPIEVLEEDTQGARYEVGLLDTSYVRDLIPGLEAGLYGASFRFKVLREDIDEEPGPSDTNPKGLPERTIREVSVAEFGPVTFPAYTGATAGVRSQTDDYIFQVLRDADPERLRTLLVHYEFLPAANEERGEEDAPTEDRAEAPHPVHVRRDVPLFGQHKEEKPRWRL